MKVSLGVVLIVIIVVVAVISGILALVPLLEASKSSSFDIAQDFSVTISERISDRVQSIFEDLQFSVDTMQRAANYSAVSVGDAKSVLRWMGPIMAATTAENAFYCLDNGTTLRFFPPAVGADPSIVSLQVIDTVANTTITASYNVSSTDLVYNASSATYASFDCSKIPYYSSVRTNRIWTDPFVLASDPTNPRLIAGAPLFDPSGNSGLREVGAFGLNFNCRYMIDYLESSDIATTGVAVVMDLRNDSVLAYHLGGALASAAVADPTALQGYRPLRASELPNSRVSDSLGGIGSQFGTCSTPCGFRIGTSYLNTLFVRVDAPYNSYNMNLRLLLVIPSGDFLSGIQTSIVIGSLAAVGAIIVLAILSAALLFSCLQPLHRLEQRLYSIAVLREDTSSTPMSFLREIYNIEVAYAGMQAELMKMKSFLPQSVLRQLEEELAEEEDNPPSDSSNSKEEDDDDQQQDIVPRQNANGQAPERNPLAVDEEQEEMDMLIQQQHTENAPAGHDGASKNRSQDVATAVLGRAAANVTNEQAPATTAFGADQQALDLLEKPTVHSDGPALALKLPMDGGRGLETGLQAVNPLQVLNTTDRAQRGGGDSPDNESLAPGQSMCTAYVNFAISENRKKRTARATLRSLNDLCVLSAKRVTVAMANVIGFHQVMEAQGASGIEKFHAILLDTVLQEVNGTSGVLDFVHGDRFLITYNASTTCLPHSICAAEMVIRVCSKLHHVGLQGYQGIRFGVSAGEALCGNFGNELMKRFSAVGPVVHQAFTLMQQTKAEETSGCGASLVCSSVYTRIKARYLAEHMNYVQLPGQTNAALISTIRGVRPSAEPFDSIMERTRVTSRRRPTLGKANRGRIASGSPAAKDLAQPAQKEGLSLSPDDPESAEVQEVLEEAAALVDKINTAFETFASGDVEAAKVLAQEIPESRCAALQKAFLVCE